MTRIQNACCVLITLLTAAPVLAQVPALEFSWRTPTDANASPVQPNGTIPIPGVLVGEKTTAVLIVRNAGPATVVMTAGRATGAGFTAAPEAATIDPNSSAVVTITFAPTAPGVANGILSLTIGVDAPRSATYLFFLSSRGLTPDFAVSYIVNPDGNQTAVGNNGTITFAPTRLGQSSTATIIINNRGAGAGRLNSVTLTSDLFKLSGLPLLPRQLDALTGEVRFTVTFTPTSLDRAQASLQLGLDSTIVRITLVGSPTGPILTYTITTGATTVPAQAGSTLSGPDVNVGESATSTFAIKNDGTAEARIAAITISGPGFQFDDVPGLPYTLATGSTLALTVRFTAREAGVANATLRIDNATFTVRATGIGRRLNLTAVVGGNRFALANNGSLAFQATDVSVKSDAAVEISNAGNTPAVVNILNVSGGVFSMPVPPGLPLTVQPGEAATIQLVFTPDSLGTATGTLQVEEFTINLRGAANTPPAVPAVTFMGLTEKVQPFQQPSVGVQIATPYPFELTGTLNIAFASDSFIDDPAIQFSTGGRSAAFRIPAGTTEALFGQGVKQVQFQGGTVAGALTMTVALATAKVNLTPTPAPAKTVLMDSAAPQLRNLQVGSQSATSVELLLTGISTSRAVTDLTLKITPAAGSSLETTTLTTNVDGAFRNWYQSDSSRAFGSQFTAAITLRITGDPLALQSIEVTATNVKGTSAPVSVSLR